MKKIGLLLIAVSLLGITSLFASEMGVSGKIRYQLEYNVEGDNSEEFTDFLKDADLQFNIPNSAVSGYFRFTTPNMDDTENKITDIEFDKAYFSVDMMKFFKEHTTSVGSKAKQDNPGLIERGIFVEKDLPEYCEEYDKIISRARTG